MKLLQPDASLDAFFQRVADSHQGLLVLDYDGTLAPFRVKRDDAVPYPGVRERLDVLATSPRTRIVVVSGRAARDVEPLISLQRRPEIWGSHGLERWTADGQPEVRELEEPARRMLERSQGWAQASGHGSLLERKPGGVALHLRGLDEAAASQLREAVLAEWADAASAGLEVHPFDGGLELRPAGMHKGVAVRALAAEEPASPMAYLGDDRTDEDAFAALRPTDIGALVREEFRPTRAHVWLRPPDELLAFLDRWLEATRKVPA